MTVAMVMYTVRVLGEQVNKRQVTLIFTTNEGEKTSKGKTDATGVVSVWGPWRHRSASSSMNCPLASASNGRNVRRTATPRYRRPVQKTPRGKMGLPCTWAVSLTTF